MCWQVYVKWNEELGNCSWLKKKILMFPLLTCVALLVCFKATYCLGYDVTLVVVETTFFLCVCELYLPKMVQVTFLLGNVVATTFLFFLLIKEIKCIQLNTCDRFFSCDTCSEVWQCIIIGSQEPLKSIARQPIHYHIKIH